MNRYELIDMMKENYRLELKLWRAELEHWQSGVEPARFELLSQLEDAIRHNVFTLEDIGLTQFEFYRLKRFARSQPLQLRTLH